MILSYDRVFVMPFDVLSLDGFPYLVPHGFPVDTELLIAEGVYQIVLTNRNVTVVIPDDPKKPDEVEAHPVLPVDEVLAVPSVPPVLTLFSFKLLEVLGITIEVVYDYYARANKSLLEVDPSQLYISSGRLWVGMTPDEPMVIVWNDSTYVVMPSSTEFSAREMVVEEAAGSIVGNKFRCKYGVLDISRRE
jgi:hypothetical protein